MWTTPCTARFWGALSRRSARRDSSLREQLQHQRRGQEEERQGHHELCHAFHRGVSLTAGTRLPECGNPSRRIRVPLIGYNNLEPSPSLAFTRAQLSFMIPKDFSKWKKIIVSHPPKRPLPEDTGPPVRLRPLGGKQGNSLPGRWAPPTGWGKGGGVISMFSTVREGFSFVLNGNFYKIFLNHKWHGWWWDLSMCYLYFPCTELLHFFISLLLLIVSAEN